MIVTFQEKDNQKYEIDNADTDKIFEEVKESLLTILEKYKKDNIDLITAIFSFGALSERLKQQLSNKYGADKIIEFTNAKLLNDIEKEGNN